MTKASAARLPRGILFTVEWRAVVEEMVREDRREAEHDALVKKHGHRVQKQHD